MFSALFYGSMIWMSNVNMASLNSLWYKVAKSTTGAVFNVQHQILEVILGVPPLLTTNRVNTIKHYLKMFSQTPDVHHEFIKLQLNHGNVAVICHLRDVLKFLQWKQKRSPQSFSESDTGILNNRDVMNLFSLSPSAYLYSKPGMKEFTESLWQETLNNHLQIQGWSRAPSVSTDPLIMPPRTSREEEVIIMSLLYSNNLLNSFLWRMSLTASPLCICNKDEQTAFHLLCNCQLVDPKSREELQKVIAKYNNAPYAEVECDTVSLLNCARDMRFLKLCKDVITTEALHLRRTIKLAEDSV